MRVLLVEDQHLLREGLKLVLEAENDIQVVAQAGTGQQALERSQDCDVVVMDLSLPDLDGLECIVRLRASGYRQPILVVTMHSSGIILRRALNVGANGYVLKSAEPNELRRALRAVHSGATYLQECLQDRLDGFPQPEAPTLTGHELNLLRWAGRGQPLEECSVSLGLSLATARSLLRSLCRKLRAEDLLQGVLRARELGLLLPDRHERGRSGGDLFQPGHSLD